MAVASSIVQASEQDMSAIVAVLLATCHDPAIFLRSADDVRNNLQDFLGAHQETETGLPSTAKEVVASIAGSACIYGARKRLTYDE